MLEILVVCCDEETDDSDASGADFWMIVVSEIEKFVEQALLLEQTA